jgi:NAD(P)-dependent dehydrogenase (short-subunit alcohol dehydrogenase family)
MAIKEKRVALVTGANRGIGFEIVRQLARNGLRVILTSRDEKKGLRAQKALAKQGFDVFYRKLDVTRPASVTGLARYLVKQHARLDVLVNNAGIMVDSFSTSVLEEREEAFHTTLDTNVFGALRVCQAVVPMMQKQDYGRIVNLSSGLGQLHDMGDGSAAYRMSKTALNALTRMLAAATAADNILVNSMCPGWVRTDMGGASASRSVEKGAETAVWLATLPDGGPTGGFFRDKKPIPW